MKKIILPAIFVLFLSNICFSQKGWPSSDRAAFISECIKTAKPRMGMDSARFYCYCMQEKVEQKYPTIEEASKITDADMRTPAWQKDIESCVSSVGSWAPKDRSDFVSECVKAAKSGLGEDGARKYCECMLYKIEKKYPNPNDAIAALTPEALATPEWKKIIQDCKDF